VLTKASHFTNTSKVWHRALNCGFKITASAGEDSILSLHGTPIMGASRVYAYLGSKLTWDGWMDAIRHGRTFVTNGPLIRFEVEGQGPGAEVHLQHNGGSVEISGQLNSIVPVDRLEVYFNGAIIDTIAPTGGGMEGIFRKRVPVTSSGWFTFRAISNESRHPIDDVYVVAETSPIYVYCGDQLIRSREDAEYFVRWIDDVARQASASPGWRSERERKHVLDQFAEARRILEQRAREAR
jgi:TolB protein